MWTCLLASCFLVFVSVLYGCSGQSEKKFDIIDNKCGTCHAPDVVYAKKRPKSEWDRLVYGMKMRGLKLTESEEKRVKKVLYENFSVK